MNFTTLATAQPLPETPKQYMAEAAARQQQTEMLARLCDGRLRLERPDGAPRIHAFTCLRGKNIVKTSGEQTLSAATKAATD